MAKKPAKDLTNAELAKRLFPKDVRKWLKEKLLEADAPKKRSPKPKKS